MSIPGESIFHHPARLAVEQTDETVGQLEVKISDDRTTRLVFKFSETIVSNALFLDRAERDHREFLNESFQILMDAVKHAAHATQILADVYFLPSFGWNQH